MAQTFKSPSGKTYTWDKDTPPTQEDIDAMVAHDAQMSGGSAPAAAPVVRPDTAQPAKPMMQRLGDAMSDMGGMGAAETGVPMQRSQAEADAFNPALAKGLRKGAATAALAAPMLVTGAGLPMAMAAGARALAGGGGYLASQAIEGETPKLSAMAQNMILAGPPVLATSAGGFFSGAGAANVAKGAGSALATVGAANLAAQSIEQGTMAPDWAQYKASLKDAVVPAIIGSAALSLGGKLQSMQKTQAEADAGRAAAAELGMADPMLGDVLPKRYGAMQQKIVSIDPNMRAKQDAARAPMAKAIFATISDSPARSPDSYARRMDYSDVSGKASDIGENGRLYAAELANYGAPSVEELSQRLRTSFSKAAQELGIQTGPNAASESWALWDAGKQLHMANNPNKSNANYNLGNPFSNTKTQEDIVDRMIGYEMTRGVASDGSRLPSHELSRIGKDARTKARVDLGLSALPPISSSRAGAPQNEQIAAQLQPIIQATDEADAAYKAAAARMDEAQALMAKAKADARIDPKTRSEIIAGAQAETMKALSDQAKASIALTVGADTLGTQTGHAEAVQDITKKLFGARSQAAGEMLAATGIPENAAIIGQNALYDAAKAALGSEAEMVAGKSILETIKNWGSKTAQDAAATKQLSLEQMARKAALEGRELTQAEVAAQLAPKGTLFRGGQPVEQFTPAGAAASAGEKYLTMDDFRRLRDAISDGFQGKIDTNNMNSAERLAAKTYHAMSDAHVAEIGRQFPDAVEPYQQFRQFWRDTSKLRDSDFGRALLRGEVADSTVAGMADKLASGNVDEIKNFKQFVDLIKPMNPEVANAAMTTMGSAVRNSFLEKATDAYGVDYRKLGELVGRYAAKKDAPFPVELFRMGDAATIKGWTKALQEFKPHDLTPEAIRSVMESPQIQQVLNVGGKDAPAQVAKAMATVAFTKRVNDAVALREAGLVQKAREAFVEANALAKRAGVDAQAAQVAMQAAEQNPLTGVFKGKGGYRLSNEAEKIEGAGTVTDLVANMRRSEARSFMDALRTQKPDLAEMVERRLVANTLQGMIKTERNVPGQIVNLDTAKVRAFFEQLPGADTDTKFSKLAAAIGQEKADRLKKFATGIAKMDDASRTAMVDAKLQPEVVNAAEFVRTGQSGSIQSGRSLGSLLRQGNNMVRTKRFNLASTILLDDGAWNAFSRNSGNYAAALAELPPQRAYLLLQDARIMNELGKDPKNQ